jgi:hypothetical protein
MSQREGTFSVTNVIGRRGNTIGTQAQGGWGALCGPCHHQSNPFRSPVNFLKYGLEVMERSLPIIPVYLRVFECVYLTVEQENPRIPGQWWELWESDTLPLVS